MKIVRSMMIASVLMFGLCLTMNTQAAESDPFRKLGRGVSNIVFGILEVPIKIMDTTKAEGGIAGATYGTFRGLGYFIAREAVGVTELVTFPVKLPGCPDDPRDTGWGYGPLMNPEWVVDTEHDAFNFVHPDTKIVNP